MQISKVGVYLCYQKQINMQNTTENTAKIEALKKINQCKWVGNTTHNTLDKCLTAINLDTFNSGWYTPKGVRINGLSGVYLVNQDGSLFCEARVIKEGENTYKIEYLTNDGWNDFERLYSTLIN